MTNYPARSFVLVYKITEAYRGRRISRSKLEEVFKLKGDLPKKRPNLQSTAADSELLLDQSELDLTLGLDISHIPIADEGQYLERESTTEDQTETSPGSPHHPEGHQEGPPGTGHHDVPDDVSSSRTQGPSAVDPPSVVGTLNPNRPFQHPERTLLYPNRVLPHSDSTLPHPLRALPRPHRALPHSDRALPHL